MLATTDLWPKGFPDILKQGPGEEVLNEAMEMVPASSIGPIQCLPHPNHENSSRPPLLALGLKTFAHMTEEADNLFTSFSLWSLFLPKETFFLCLQRPPFSTFTLAVGPPPHGLLPF